MGNPAFASPTPIPRVRPTVSPRTCRRPTVARIGEKTLAVDYGLRRVGLAVSVGVAPRPLPRVEHNRSPREAAAAVAETARATVSSTILVGLPVDIYGRECEQVTVTRTFIRELVAAAPWATILSLDERFTSQDAREGLARAGVKRGELPLLIDSASAVVLLERFFSDADEVRAEEVHRPAHGIDAGGVRQANRLSFAEWKRAAMAKAERSAREGYMRKR